MEHAVRVVLRLAEGRPTDFRPISFGTGSRINGLEARARRRRYVFNKEAGT